jgi:uncharacterized protein YndB with AHSA1/START domain
MKATVGDPFVWRLSLASSPEHVFELLDTDEGRERFWAQRSRIAPEGFDLHFPGGLEGRVVVVDREPPARMVIRYFGSEAEFELTPQEDGGSLFQVTCRCDDPAAWLEFYPGWVSWLLVLKAAADFAVDLRNGSPERAWEARYVDQ